MPATGGAPPPGAYKKKRKPKKPVGFSEAITKGTAKAVAPVAKAPKKTGKKVKRKAAVIRVNPSTGRLEGLAAAKGTVKGKDVVQHPSLLDKVAEVVTYPVHPRTPVSEDVQIAKEGLEIAAPIPGAGKIKALGKAGSLAAKVFKGSEKAAPKVRKVKDAPAKLEKALAKKAAPKKPVKAKVKDAPKAVAKRTKQRYDKPGRKIRRDLKIQRAAQIGAASVPAATVAAAVGKETAEGLIDDPGKTLKTTANAVPGIGAALIGDVAALARGDFKHIAKEQEDYYELLSGIAAGSDKIKVGETKDGEPIYRTAKEAVQEDVGLVPAIFGAVGATAGARLARGSRPVKVKRANPLGAKDAPNPKNFRQGRKDRSRVARLHASYGDKGRGDAARDLKAGGLNKAVRKASKKKVAGNVTEADIIRFVAAHGVPRDRAKGLAFVKRIEAKLTDPHYESIPDVKDTRAVIAAIKANPASLESKHVGKAVEARRQSAQAVSVERGKMEGRKGPLDEDERARQVHQANVLDELLPEERIPHGLRGVTKVKPRKGQNATKAIREEARKTRKTAKTLKRRADAERARARATARELNVRRIADDRRVVARKKSAKVRRLEKRLAAWEAKLAKAKKPDTRKRYAAKVQDLKQQITATKATERLAASPVRLRTVRRVTEQRTKAQELRAQADAELRRAETLESSVNRLSRADALERAGKLEEAQALRRDYFADQAKLLSEFNERMAVRRQKEGLDEPIFFKEKDSTTAPDRTGGAEGFRGSTIPAQEKLRTGSLAQQGRVRESGQDLVEGVVSQRLSMAATQMMRDFVDEFAFRPKGSNKPLIVTGRQFDQLQREGKIPPGYAQLAVQEVNRAFQRGRWAEAQGLVDSPIHAALRESRHSPGKKYLVVPRSARKELDAQGQPLDPFFRGAKWVGRVQSGLLLGLSPAWFAFQLGATPLSVLLRNPNVLHWPKALAQQAKLARTADKSTRDAFKAHIGATTSDILEMRDVHITADKSVMASMAKAQRFASMTWFGRILSNLRRGGPLLDVNRRYEGAWREFEAILEVDRLIRENRRPDVHRYAQSISELDATTKAHIAAMKKLPIAERIEYYNTNLVARRELERRVDDAVGNWSALTTTEKKAASVAIFYPFLRFSLRWTFYAFPKNNPGKAVGLAALANINAIQLELMLGEGEDLGSFYNYSKSVAGDDKLLALGRLAPGSNAIFEALGGSRAPLQAALAPAQPIIGATFSALAGQDAYSGQPLRDKSRIQAFGEDAVSLAVPARELAESIGGSPSAYSQLFRKIRNQSQDAVRRSVIPDFTADPEQEADAIAAGRALELAFEGSGDEQDQAKLTLAALFTKYGMPVPEGLSPPSTSPTRIRRVASPPSGGGIFGSSTSASSQPTGGIFGP